MNDLSPTTVQLSRPSTCSDAEWDLRVRLAAAYRMVDHFGWKSALIVGLALLIFGSGPVRGFAVVHCLGILTSMFSAVFVSRGFVNLWYGRRGKKVTKLSVGTVWTPGLPAEKK